MDPAEGLIDHPYAVYDRLRDTAPVHRVAGTDGNPAWLVTRYEDVREALANPLLSMDKKHALPGSYQGLSLPPALDANLLNMEAPDHTRIRRLVVRAFTARRIEQLRTPVRETADRLLDALGPHGSVDLMTAYAAPLPITVICDLLGIPGSTAGTSGPGPTCSSRRTRRAPGPPRRRSRPCSGSSPNSSRTNGRSRRTTCSPT